MWIDPVWKNKIQMREFGSEFASIALPDTYFTNISTNFTDFAFLRSGRDGLGLIEQNIDSERKCILLPAYCCDSMVYPFIRKDWKVYYYCLNADLTADLDALEKCVTCYSPDAILVMNYFGIAPTDRTIQKIRSFSPEVIIIEDFTHCLFDRENIHNCQVDYYVASIRKWMGVNDGAIILARHLIKNKPLYVETDFVKIRQEAQAVKRQYFVTGKSEEKEIYRVTLQNAEKCLAEDPYIVGMSPTSLKILNSLNVAEIKFRRRQNYFHLLNSIKDICAITFPGNITDIYTPFSLPILIKDRDALQRRLADCNLYAPVLWPIDGKAGEICKVSLRMAREMLSIPIDQRYDYADIEDIAQIIHSVFKLQ